MKKVVILGGQRCAHDIVTDETYNRMKADFLNIGNEPRPTAHCYVTACGGQEIVVNWSLVAQMTCYDEDRENEKWDAYAAHQT